MLAHAWTNMLGETGRAGGETLETQAWNPWSAHACNTRVSCVVAAHNSFTGFRVAPPVDWCKSQPVAVPFPVLPTLTSNGQRSRSHVLLSRQLPPPASLAAAAPPLLSALPASPDATRSSLSWLRPAMPAPLRHPIPLQAAPRAAVVVRATVHNCALQLRRMLLDANPQRCVPPLHHSSAPVLHCGSLGERCALSPHSRECILHALRLTCSDTIDTHG